MKETFTVYKAVRLVMGDFYSSTIGLPRFVKSKKWELRYILGEETVAHEGSVGILCFVGSLACQAFIENLGYLYPNEWFAVLECATEHVPHRQYAVIDRVSSFPKWVTRYAEWPSIDDFNGIDQSPEGTYVVPSLTPRRIYKEDTR